MNASAVNYIEIPHRFAAISDRAEKVISWLISLLKAGHPLSCGYSGGKDSNCTLVLFLEAIKRCRQEGLLIPECFITHSNTLIENPAIDFYTGHMLDCIQRYTEDHDLPISLHIVHPTLSSTFAYATIGRGKLPRFRNSHSRECSIDWKVRPQQRAIKEIIKHTVHIKSKELVCLVGTRLGESSNRKSRMSRDGHDNEKLVDQGGGMLSNACIADWDLTEVWEFLIACDPKRGGIYSTFVEDFEWTLELYKDANEGVCAIVVGESGSKTPCQSRFGCSLCTVSGEKDKSMTAMIASDEMKYGHLKGINRLRDLLVNTQYDLSKRDWLGRSLSPAGYARLRPDNYSIFFRRTLLRYMLTLDVVEQERAEQLEADIFTGRVENTVENRRLASTQFQFITPQLLLAIDLAWSVQRDFPHAFPAVREWYEIYELGKRYEVPESNMIPRAPIPEARWFHVGSFNHPWNMDGLRDWYGEAANSARRPNDPPFMTFTEKSTGEERRVVLHETEAELTIEPADATLFVMTEFEDLYFTTLNLDARESLLFMLDRGLIKIGAGHIGKYDFMARRGQYYDRLKAGLNIASLKEYLTDHSVSNAEHTELLAAMKNDDEMQDIQIKRQPGNNTEEQLDLFA